MGLRYFGLATTLAATLALANPAHAVTELQWWHAMTGGNNSFIIKLAEDFNASQSDYKVVPSYKGSYADTMNAGIAAFRAGNAPNIIQVFEVGTATMMSATGAIKPVYQLMKEAGHITCGFSNAWATWANIEQFSAWHNVPIGTKANGLDGFDTVLAFN